jgi:hypothetical protein
MATSDSPLNIKGSIKNLRFYKMEGSDKTYVGEKGGANVDQIRNNPVFKGLRKAQNELKGRSMMASDIRRALGQWSWPVINRHLLTKIEAVLQQLQNTEPLELKGRRAIYLTRYKEVLNQVPWYYYKPFNELMMCPFNVESGEDKRSVTVKISGLNPRIHIKAPAAATHFRLVLAIGTVTDCVVWKGTKNYKTALGRVMNTTTEVLSEWIPIDGPLMEDVSLTASLNNKVALSDTQSVLRCISIVFGKMTYMVTEIPRDRGSIAFLGAI